MSTPYKDYKHPKIAVFLGYGLIAISITLFVCCAGAVVASKYVFSEFQKGSRYVADVSKMRLEVREAELKSIKPMLTEAILKRCVASGKLSENDRKKLIKVRADEVVSCLQEAKKKAQHKEDESRFLQNYIITVFAIASFLTFCLALAFAYGGRKLTERRQISTVSSQS